ncbi:MAG TPA: hypothetical protein VNK67_14990 [Burkholderiales bacterium]|nr:hypothetical protein [Burkholderiales bacterium]
MGMPSNSQPRYEVLWPLGRRAVEPRAVAPRLPDLAGRTICELWDVIFRGETIYPLVRDYIRARYPGVRFVEYTEFGNFYGPRGAEVARALPEKLRAHRCEAAIVGIGA